MFIRKYREKKDDLNCLKKILMAGNKIELKLSIKENLFQPEKQKQM